jgi:hypothetical protein
MFLQQNMKHTITSSKSSANSSKARWVRISTLLKPNGLYESRGGSPHSSLDYQTPTEFVAGWQKELITGARVSR